MRVIFFSRISQISLISLLTLSGCEHRKPIKVAGDAGPVVEVVDTSKLQAPTQTAKQPLVDEKEPDDDVAHAQPMEPGKGIRGTVGGPKDADVFSWMDPTPPRDLGPRPTAGAPSAADNDAGFDYARVELTGIPGIDLAVDVLDGDGKRLVTANDGGPGEYEVIPNVGVDPAHTYYLRVHAVGAAQADPDHPYELTVQPQKASESDEREPNDDPAHATPVKLTSGTSGDASGFFGRKRDEDWLSLSLAGVEPAAGNVPGAAADERRAKAKDGRAILRLELAPAQDVAPSLKVTAPGGKELFAEARGAKNDELRLRNVSVDTAAGSVLIALRAVEGKSTEARWVLRMGVEPPFDNGSGGAEREPNNDAAHATPLPLANGTAQIAGFLWPGDADVYRVSGASPEAQLGFEVDGVDKVDLKLERIGADGKSWVRADDAPTGQGELLPPARAGEGLVRVSARPRDTAFDAPYRLTVTMRDAPPDEEREPNDGMSTATPWLPGATVMKGRLAPRGDEDWYSFTATASPAAAHFSGPMPASVKIVDEKRRVVLPGTALTAGKRYFIVVKAATEKSSNPRESYTLTLGP